MVPPFPGRICPYQFDETAHRIVRLAEPHPGRGTVLLLREAIGF
jgi:hypothetical protein